MPRPLVSDHTLDIAAEPAAIIAAFFDPAALSHWWTALRSVTAPRTLGVYAIEWVPTPFRDELFGPLGGVLYGTVMDYREEPGALRKSTKNGFESYRVKELNAETNEYHYVTNHNCELDGDGNGIPDDCDACNLHVVTNCFTANGGPGCSEPCIEASVCAIDPFCCATDWDAICAGEAVSIGVPCDCGHQAECGPSAARRRVRSRGHR